MGSAVLTLAALTGKKASAQSCQPPQHFTSEFRLFVPNDCLNEYTLLNAVIKQTVQTCLNTDGSVSYRFQYSTHGTGQGYDSVTNQPAGTSYILNQQTFERFVTGPVACGDQPLSLVYIDRLELISKGSAPNNYILMETTFSLDSSCNPTINFAFHDDCRG
jgi:hypothetical protein